IGFGTLRLCQTSPLGVTRSSRMALLTVDVTGSTAPTLSQNARNDGAPALVVVPARERTSHYRTKSGTVRSAPQHPQTFPSTLVFAYLGIQITVAPRWD